LPDPSDALLAMSERLIALRIGNGYDLETLAALSHVDAERLADAEAGEAPLDEAELQRVADAYGLSITALFGGRTTPLNYLAGA
jgi:transcriptional regulator with XRE-family HTH domain